MPVTHPNFPISTVVAFVTEQICILLFYQYQLVGIRCIDYNLSFQNASAVINSCKFKSILGDFLFFITNCCIEILL